MVTLQPCHPLQQPIMVGRASLHTGQGTMATEAGRAPRKDMVEALERDPIQEDILEMDPTLEGTLEREAIQEEILEKVLILAERPEKEAGYLKGRLSLRE